MSRPGLLEREDKGGVTVVRFTRRTILDPSAIEEVGASLLGLVQDEGRRGVVVNFNNVESLTSAMLGKLVSLHQVVGAEGGRLAFSNVDPFLRHIFAVCKLPPDIPIHADEAGAVGALQTA